MHTRLNTSHFSLKKLILESNLSTAMSHTHSVLKNAQWTLKTYWDNILKVWKTHSFNYLMICLLGKISNSSVEWMAHKGTSLSTFQSTNFSFSFPFLFYILTYCFEIERMAMIFFFMCHVGQDMNLNKTNTFNVLLS